MLAVRRDDDPARRAQDRESDVVNCVFVHCEVQLIATSRDNFNLEVYTRHWRQSRGEIMIIGTHTLLFSPDPVRDREFLRDIFGFPHVDAGGGWLIFRVPPAEMGVHPVNGERQWEICFMTDDVRSEIERLSTLGCSFTPVVDQGYGLVTRMTLPGGARLDLYQPKHEMAIAL